MALYNEYNYLNYSNSEAFRTLNQPGAIAPHSGIYKNARTVGMRLPQSKAIPCRLRAIINAPRV